MREINDLLKCSTDVLARGLLWTSPKRTVASRFRVGDVGWVEFASLELGIIALGVGVISVPQRPVYWFARASFILAALAFFAQGAFWGMITEQSTASRVLILGIAGALALIALGEGLRWIDRTKSSGAPSPVSSAPSTGPTFNITGANPVISMNQSGGQTAHTIVNNPQPPKWELTKDEQQALSSALDGKRPIAFQIYWYQYNDQSFQYADALLRVFRNKGWQGVYLGGDAYVGPEVFGLSVNTSNDEARNPPANALVLKSLLEQAGIVHRWGTEDVLSRGSIALKVGRPPHEASNVSQPISKPLLPAELRTAAVASEIDALYADAVKLRNHAASLRVLDTQTEFEMNRLQTALLEKMREVAPMRSINLNTLNVYDRSDHPAMALQDPKRTLEFSEFLRRVMTILDSRD